MHPDRISDAVRMRDKAGFFGVNALSRETELSSGTIKRFFTGRNVDKRSFYTITNALGISPEDLLEKKQEEEMPSLDHEEISGAYKDKLDIVSIRYSACFDKAKQILDKHLQSHELKRDLEYLALAKDIAIKLFDESNNLGSAQKLPQEEVDFVNLDH